MWPGPVLGGWIGPWRGGLRGEKPGSVPGQGSVWPISLRIHHGTSTTSLRPDRRALQKTSPFNFKGHSSVWLCLIEPYFSGSEGDQMSWKEPPCGPLVLVELPAALHFILTDTSFGDLW